MNQLGIREGRFDENSEKAISEIKTNVFFVQVANLHDISSDMNEFFYMYTPRHIKNIFLLSTNLMFLFHIL